MCFQVQSINMDLYDDQRHVRFKGRNFEIESKLLLFFVPLIGIFTVCWVL